MCDREGEKGSGTMKRVKRGRKWEIQEHAWMTAEKEKLHLVRLRYMIENREVKERVLVRSVAGFSKRYKE